MPLRNDIVARARQWINTPYQHQASLKGVGCDCLGLVRGIWRETFGAEPEAVPAYSPDWAEAGAGEQLVMAGQRHMIEVPVFAFDEGDVLLFRWQPHLPAKHVGIATSRTAMIHAQEGACVTEVKLTKWWLRRLAHAFRFPEIE
jgi:NlpC/P60 family putative phage cell wall peptidase